MLLQTIPAEYNQIEIVIGMIICMAVIIFAIKYLTPKKIEITGIQAMDITTEMIDKVKNVTLGGSTIEKRASKLQHDTAQALANHSDMSSLVSEVIETNTALVNEVKNLTKSVNNLNNNITNFYQSQDQKTTQLNKSILDLLVKNKRNGNNTNR